MQYSIFNYSTQKLQRQSEKVATFKTVDELRGAEGIAAKNYFSAFPELINITRWSWKGRSQHPAADPVNALLNYGYAFLEREVRIAAAVAGMDARFGFFHSNDGRKDSLVYDLMELFRQSVIDRFVLTLLNRKMISPDDFDKSKTDCRLTFDAVKIFCTRYEEYMSKKYSEYDGKNTRDVICERIKTFAECLRR